MNDEGGDVMVNFEYTVTKLSEVFSIRDTDVLKVQVGADDTVEVKGSIDRMNFEPLTAVNDNGLVITKPITKKGLYTFDINGLAKIEITKSLESTSVTIVGVN